MPEDYGLQLSLSLPPVAQYAKGHMLNIRGRNVSQFVENLAAARELAEKDALLAKFFAEVETEALETVKKELKAKPVEDGPPARPLAEDRPAATDGKPSRVASGITDKQKGLVFAIARRKELSDDDLLAHASAVAGGKVFAVSDLTKAEASALIDRLQSA